jgi:hypothetical protein
MPRKLTIMIDDEVYEGLYSRIGPRKIGRFLESLARPHVIDSHLESEYRSMAADEVREAAALEWADDFIADVVEGSVGGDE